MFPFPLGIYHQQPRLVAGELRMPNSLREESRSRVTLKASIPTALGHNNVLGTVGSTFTGGFCFVLGLRYSLNAPNNNFASFVSETSGGR